jgi:hypothetical protein
MDKNAFSNLCNMFEARGGLKDTKHMLVDEQVAMFLYILAHHVKNRIIKRQFRRSGETIIGISKTYYMQLYGYTQSNINAICTNKTQYQNIMDKLHFFLQDYSLCRIMI